MRTLNQPTNQPTNKQTNLRLSEPFSLKKCLEPGRNGSDGPAGCGTGHIATRVREYTGPARLQYGASVGRKNMYEHTNEYSQKEVSAGWSVCLSSDFS